MNEKKLTDDEIVKGLDCLCGFGNCNDCKYFTGNGFEECVKNVAVESIALIHNLQAVNRWLLDRCKIKDGEIAEQKAEIEWLKNAYREGLEQGKFDSQVKIAELQKQVDEQRHLVAVASDTLSETYLRFEKTEKDTAKEIVAALKNKMSDIMYSHGLQVCAGLDIAIKVVLRVMKSKGVEVE